MKTSKVDKIDKIVSDNTLFLQNKFNLDLNEINKKTGLNKNWKNNFTEINTHVYVYV